jgi:hypothetical protein
MTGTAIALRPWWILEMGKAFLKFRRDSNAARIVPIVHRNRGRPGSPRIISRRLIASLRKTPLLCNAIDANCARPSDARFTIWRYNAVGSFP